MPHATPKLALDPGTPEPPPPDTCPVDWILRYGLTLHVNVPTSFGVLTANDDLPDPCDERGCDEEGWDGNVQTDVFHPCEWSVALNDDSNHGGVDADGGCDEPQSWCISDQTRVELTDFGGGNVWFCWIRIYPFGVTFWAGIKTTGGPTGRYYRLDSYLQLCNLGFLDVS